MIIRWLLLGAGILGLALGPAQACDICGCSGGGSTLGVLPMYHTHFAGLRWQSLTYRYGGYEAQDQFQQLEAWGRWYPHPRVQVMVAVPYRVLGRTEATNAGSLHGIGDARMHVSYSLILTPDSSTKRWHHHLLVGAGLKVPTGQFRPPGEGDLPMQFQLGSGSTDLLGQLLYQLRRGQWGLHLQASARANGAHRSGYRFGDQVQGMAYAFYWHRRGRRSLMPYAGLSGEVMARDVARGFYQAETGGWGSFCLAGLEASQGRLVAGAQAQLPLRQHYAEGAIISGPRTSVYVNFLL
jgi:hypothetical protein